MSRFKKILLIFLLALPFLISTGLSAWIIVNVKENENPPDYNYKDIVNNAFNGQDKDYTGEALGPDGKYNGSENNEIIDSDSFKFCYFDEELNEWIEGLPTNSGSWQIKVVNPYDPDAEGIFITFTINKAEQKITVSNLLFTYDGQEHTVDEEDITVVFGEGTLSISAHTPRVDAGETEVTITLSETSNFKEFETTVKIVVEPKNIGAEDVSGVVSTKYTYDGTNKEPSHDDLTLIYNGMTLDSSDYKILSYANNLNATKDTLATVTIEGIGNYNGTRTIEFEIAKANQTVSYNQFNVYNGSPAEVIVDTNDEVELTKTANVEFFDLDKNPITAPTNVGTYYVKVTIDGTDNYNAYDSDYVEYRVTPLDIANVDISSIDDIKYTASAITLPTPTITYNGNSLVEGLDQDYTLTYQNAAGNEVTEIINAGTYRVIVTGHGNFTGTKEIEFKVVKNAISAGIVTIPNETYTGNAITPNVTIIYDDEKLTAGVDYELSYAEIKNVGTYQVTIKGIGLYEGTKSSTLTVVEASIKDVEITGLDSLVYTGSVIDINPVIKFNGMTLAEGTDYSYEIYKSSTETSVLEAGNYVLKVTGSGNFTDSTEIEFSVSLRSVLDVTFNVASNTYNALDQEPIVTATFNSTTISQDNYTVSYEYTEFVDAGEYTLTITGKGNLTGTTTVKYEIEKLDISNALAEYENTHYFTAEQIKPAITLTYASKLLTSGTDYTVVYGDNIEVGENVGTITVTATESSNFTGSKIYYFSIVKESIESAEIEGYESTIKYTGNQYTPDITVSLNGVTLTQDDDYTVEYGTNVNAGTTTFIKITGTGIYSGSKTVEITIIKADITGITFSDKEIVYSGNNNKLEIVGTLPTDVTVQYYYNNAVFTGATTVGEYLVTAQFTVNNANYNSLSDMTATLNITKATYDMSKVVFEDQVFTYDGNYHMVEIASGVPQGVTFKYYYNGQEFAGAKDFGTYDVVVKFTGDSTNYNEINDKFATLTINKVKPVITITNNIYNVDYNSDLNLANNYSISNNPDDISETVSILDDLGNDVTNNGVLSVGTYTVTVTITGNTNTETVTNSFTLEINKVNPEYTVPTNLTGIYGNQLSTVELPTGWSFDSPETVMNVVGEFNATITFTPEDTQNYNTVTETITIDVRKATITGITFESAAFTYDGTVKNILINGTLPTGVTVKYYVDDVEFSGAIKAGTYEITAKFTDTTGNYNDVADLTATLTINQATFDMTDISFDSVNVDYNGQTHNLELTGTLPTNLGVKYYIGSTEFTPQTNAGTYVVIARFEDLSDGGANYILPSDLTATLTINQIMDPAYQEQPDLTAVFGQTLDDIKSQLLDGWAFTDDLQTSVGNGGINKFEVKYTPSDATNYLTVTKTIEVTVNRIDPTFNVDNNNYTYDGSSKVATVTSNSTGTITVIYKLNGSIVDTPINAGNYDIYVTISETQNYNSVTELKLDSQLVINMYKIDETNASIGTIANQEYTGSTIEPSVNVTLYDTSIPFDASCYTVTYQNNIDLGTATVIVTATGNFEGTLETSFTITQGAITDQSITAIEDVEYTGKDAIYDLIVTVNGKVLTKDTDYIVTVSDDIVNVGTVTIKVEGTGNYSGTGTVSFDITPVNINTSENITIADQVFVEGGNTPLPIVTITNIGTLQNYTDYTLTYTNNLGVGTGTVTIEGTGNFTGTIDVTFTITPKDIKDIEVEISENLVYTGNKIEPVTVTDVKLTDYPSLTYNISYTNNINAGTASYTITGTKNFTGSVTKEFTISKFNLSELEDTQITLSGSTTYTALQITPSVTITFNGKTLEDSNYTIIYGENINIVDGGTLTIIAQDNTNFTGSRLVEFDITARSITDAAVTVSDQTYTGSPITPNPQVVIDGIGTLVNGTDYELTYSSNVNVSSSPVTITITAKGNFAGQLTTTFKILPIDITNATVAEILDVNYTGSAIEPEPTVTLTGFGKLTKDTDYKVTYEDNTFVGTAKVIITGMGNFTGTVSQEFNIIDSIASSDVYFGELLNNPGEFTYTVNTSHKPDVTKVIINNVTLVEGTHYEVTYGENINAGTGYVYITAIAGSGYEGSKEITFTINKATQTINYENIHVTYDGNNHMITATSSVGLGITYFDENDVTFTGAENAGTYTVIIKAAGSENYEATQVTATIQIDKFNIENLVVGTHINGFQNSFVYTSNPITQELTILFNNKSINDQLTIAYENNTNPTTSAKVLISVNSTDSNFTGTKELTFTITKAEQVITAENIEVVYGTSYDVTYTRLGDGTVNIKYYLGEEEISKPTDVGTYKAVISVLEGTYHLAGSKEITITITGINPTFEITSNVFDYTGQPVTIEYTTNSNGQVTIVYKQNGVVVENPTNAGEYSVEITQAASGNYLAYETTSTLVIKKIKPEILVSGLTADGKIYFEYLVEYDLTENIEVTNNPENLDYTIYYNGVTTKPTNPGSYEVTVTIPATENSEEASSNFTLVINKIDAKYSGNTEFTATYGDLLSTITLPDGLTWKEPTATVGNVNTSPNKHTAIYNPDEDLYNSVEVELSVVVEKAIPTYTIPTELEGKIGQTLAEITLSDGWAWSTPTTVLNILGNNTYKATYTPGDTNNYNTVTVDVTVTVVAASIQDATVSGYDQTITYSGTTYKPEITVMYGSTTLVEDTDYKVTYGDVVNAGETQTITIQGLGNYSGTKDIEITIEKAKLTKPTASSATYTYSNSSQTYTPVNFDAAVMNITGNVQTNAGSHKVVVSIKDTANYEWADETTTDLEFTFVISARSINDSNITVSTLVNKEYTGLEIVQDPTVSYNGNALTKGTDYTLSYSYNDDNFGTVTITITGSGNFKDSRTATFEIVKASQTIDTSAIDTSLTYNGSSQSFGSASAKTTVSYWLGTTEITGLVDAGTYVVTIKAEETTYYQAASTTVTITVEKAKLPKPTASSATYTYSGSSQTYTPNGFDSSLMNISGNVQTAADTYDVVVTLKDANNYSWTDGTNTNVEFSFVINPFDLSNLSDSQITLSTDLTYTGLQIKPAVTISFNGTTLESTNYIVSYGNNVTVAEGGTVIIGPNSTNFTGSKTVSFEITKATPTYTNNVNLTATYGQTLADITAQLPEHFTWKDDAQSVGNASTTAKQFTALYNPDSANYNDLEVSVNVTVGKATPTYTDVVNLTATYGQTLADITAQLPEHFTWKDSTQSVGNASTTAKQFTALYNPDSANYNDLEVSVNVTVGKATPTYTDNVNLTATYGQTLADIASQLPEYFTWKDSTQSVGNASTTAKQFTALYNPDSANYNDLEVSVNVTVGKATPTYDSTTSLTYVYGTVLQDIVLEGITWNNPTGTVGNVNGSPNSHIATYNPDSTNYNDTTVTFNITVTQKVITGITFSNGKFNYDGYVHSLEISGTLPEGVNVEYLNNGQTEVGLYTVTAQFTDTTGNYVVPEDMTATLEITDKESIKIEILDTTVTYTGKEQDIIINLYDENGELITDQTKITEIMSLITVLYDSSSDKPIDVKYSGTTIDTYEASISYTDNDNYELTCSSTTTALLTINPQEITSDNISEITETFTYNGSKHTPEVEVTVNDKVLTKDTDYTVYYGANTNVGDGYVTIVGKTNYSGTVELTFNITQAELTLNDSDWPTISPFVEGITPALSFTSATINSVNGTFKFVNDVSNVEYQGTESTYNGTLEVIFSPENSNYKDVTKEISYIMYAVAYVGSTYYGTIADAVSAANTGTTKTAYVVPGLCNTYGISIPINSNITIPNGVSLYVPYSGTSYNNQSNFGDYSARKTYADENADAVAEYRATIINLRNGADIIIESGANLYLGGEIYTFGIVGLYAEINLGQGSMINCKGSFYCYGYVKENVYDYSHGNQSANQMYYHNEYDLDRSVLIDSGGYIETFIAMYDMKNASNLLKLKDSGVFALNLFDFPNLQTYTEIIYGATFKTYTYLVAENSQSNQSVHEEILVVDTQDALFNLSSGSLVFEYCPNDVTYTSKNALTRIYINGEIEQGYAEISMSVPILGDITVTSKDKFLPISYRFNVFVNDNGIYSTAYDVKFLPGSLLQINNGGLVNLDGAMVFYDGSYYNKIISYTNSNDSTLINNGTIILSGTGKIAGLLQTTATDDSAILNFESCTSSGNFSVTSIEGYDMIEITQVAEGYFVDTSDEGKGLYQFVEGTIVYSDGNGNMCWTGEYSNTRTITVNIADSNYAVKIFSYEILIADDANGTNSTQIQAVTQSAGVYEIILNKYIQINVTRHASAIFGDGTTHSSSEWYLVDEDMSLTIEPSEGLKLIVKTDSASGNGSVVFSIHESSTETGSYYVIDTLSTGSTSYTVYVVKNAWFKLYVDNPGTGTTKLDEDNYTITPKDGTASKFYDETAYQMTTEYTVYLPRTEGISTGGSCVAEGTLITMADGTKKKVENIVSGDILIVFNHETGQYETAEVLFNDTETINNYVVINLEFSNGSLVKVISEHGFFDLDLMEYVYIDEYNYLDYVGHRFVAATMVNGEMVQTVVTLDNAYLTEEYIRVYSPVTKYHLNYLTEDLLSMPGGIKGLFNIFEYDDNLQYNQELMQQDIETYGLFTYEDFKDLVSYEVYCSFPAQYFKVALGKGILTWEDLTYYIERYAPLV